MNQHSQPWSPADNQKLAALYATHTIPEIAAALGRGVRGIESQARRQHLSKAAPPFSAHEQAVMREYYPTGGSAAVLPLLPGRKPKAVYDWASRNGLGYKAWSDASLAHLTELCAQGVRFMEIAKQLNRHRNTIREAIKQYNIAYVAPAPAPKPPKPVYVGVHRQPEIQRQVQELAAEGLPAKAIAERMGLAEMQVRRVGYTLNLTFTPAPRRTPSMRVVRPVKEKVAKAPKPEKAPKMQVARAAKPDYRSEVKVPQGKKRTTRPKEAQDKLSDYLKPLPLHHPHRQAYFTLTRPGQPRRSLKTLGDLLTAMEEAHLALAA